MGPDDRKKAVSKGHPEEVDLDEAGRWLFDAFEDIQRRSRPAPDLRVYCDRHLDVRMRPWRFFGLGAEYDFGEAKADVNAMDYWGCPDPACDRCYDPRFRGYFSFGREMGSRIQTEVREQQRCNKHPERPAMYIGKAGEGRQLFCPFYKCDGRGGVITNFVADREVVPPQEEEKPSHDDQNRKLERKVFESFAEAMRPVVEISSIENDTPPRPDIRCMWAGQPRWFELGQIVSEELRKAIDPRKPRGSLKFSQEAPFLRLLQKKMTSAYDPHAVPVDLLLWFDLTLGTAGSVRDLIEKHRAQLAALMPQGRFSRVWIYDHYSSAVVWIIEAP